MRLLNKKTKTFTGNFFLFLLFLCANIINSYAQQKNTLTAKNYELAESRLQYNTEPLVDNNFNGRPVWVAGDKFWYRILTARGAEFILVDPAKASRAPAFNQQKLAAAISASTGKIYSEFNLPFQTFSFSPDQKSILFQADHKSWICDLQNYTCSPDNTPIKNASSRAGINEIISPDGKKTVFIKAYNLW